MEASLVHVHELVKQLGTTNNEMRRTAETQLDNYKQQPDFLLSALIHWVTHSEDPTVRSLCAVLHGRYAFHHFQGEKPLWDAMMPATQSSLRSALLTALRTEAITPVRTKISHAVADLAISLSSIQEWPEVLEFIAQSAMNSGNPALREQAYQLLDFLADRLGDDLVSLLPSFKVILHMGLTLADSPTADTPCDLRARLSALKATVSFLHGAKNVKQLLGAQFEAVPPMMQTVTLCLQYQQEEMAREALSALMDATEAHPSMFRNFIDPIISTFMPFILAAEEYRDVTQPLEMMTRNAIIEWLVTLTEKSPVLFKRHATFTASFVPVLLTLMSEFALEDGDDDADAEWYAADELEDEDLDAIHIVAEQAIDRLAFSLGGRALWPTVLSILPSCLSNRIPIPHVQSTKPRPFQLKHATLMCLSAMAEGCLKAMLPDLGKIVQEILIPCMHDAHPRVRFACCNAMGQLSTDFAPKMQKRYASLIMPALLHAMRPEEHTRVQAHAAAATINFCEHASKSVIEPYLDPLLQSLVTLLQNPKKYLQIQAITSIAVVAMTAKAHMLRHYAQLMALLMTVMQQATSKEYRLLRGKAMECATLIGLSVGKEVFRDHAHQLMSLISNPQLDPDDPQATFMMASWSRIARCLGMEFLPYLPSIMPPLMEAAAVKPQYDILAEEDDDQQKEGYEYVDLGTGEKLGIKTSIVEEKATAVEMLRHFAVELAAGFAPYAVEVVKLLVPLLNFVLDDSIKSSAAMALAPLLSSLFLAGNEAALLDMWLLVHAAFMDVLKVDDDGLNAETASLYWSAYRKCIGAMMKSSARSAVLSQLPAAIALSQTTLQALMGLFEERKRDLGDDAEDGGIPQEEQDEIDLEEDVMSELTDFMHIILEKTKSEFLPQLNPCFSILAQFLNDPHASEIQRQWALCAFDDLIEFTGPLSLHYSQAFWPIILRCLSLQPTSRDDALCPPSLLQAAAYGVGVAAQHASEAYKQALSTQAYPLLIQILSTSSSLGEEYIDALDNVIAAVVKYLKFVSQQEIFAALPVLLKALPLKVDEDETDIVYGFLCDVLEQCIAQNQMQWMAGREKDVCAMLLAASQPREVTEELDEDGDDDGEADEQQDGKKKVQRNQDSDVARVGDEAIRVRMNHLAQQLRG